jgi:hypothetical protein
MNFEIYITHLALWVSEWPVNMLVQLKGSWKWANSLYCKKKKWKILIAEVASQVVVMAVYM